MRPGKKTHAAMPDTIVWQGQHYLTVPREVTLTEIADELVDGAVRSILEDGRDGYETQVFDDAQRAFIGFPAIIRRYVTMQATARGLQVEVSGWSFTFSRAT